MPSQRARDTPRVIYTLNTEALENELARRKGGTRMSTPAPQPSVDIPTQNPTVGLTTIVGYLVTALAPILSILFAEWFSLPKEDAVVIAGQVLGVLAFIATQLGRYWQAKELARGASAIAEQHARSASELAMAEMMESRYGGGEVAATAPGLAPIQGAGPDLADLEKVEEQLRQYQQGQP